MIRTIIYPEGQPTGGSLPCPRNLITPLTGNKEGNKELLVSN